MQGEMSYEEMTKKVASMEDSFNKITQFIASEKEEKEKKEKEAKLKAEEEEKKKHEGKEHDEEDKKEAKLRASLVAQLLAAEKEDDDEKKEAMRKKAMDDYDKEHKKEGMSEEEKKKHEAKEKEDEEMKKEHKASKIMKLRKIAELIQPQNLKTLEEKWKTASITELNLEIEQAAPFVAAMGLGEGTTPKMNNPDTIPFFASLTDDISDDDVLTASSSTREFGKMDTEKFLSEMYG